MDDSVWTTSDTGTHFVCMHPNNGKPISHPFRTEWKAAYDNKAVYFIIQMYDPAPDSILKQLSPRDDMGDAADFIGVFINPYNDGQTDFGLFVSAAGVQGDGKFNQEGENADWDIVWELSLIHI